MTFEAGQIRIKFQALRVKEQENRADACCFQHPVPALPGRSHCPIYSHSTCPETNSTQRPGQTLLGAALGMTLRKSPTKMENKMNR